MWRLALERSSGNAVAYSQQRAVLYAAALLGGGGSSWCWAETQARPRVPPLRTARGGPAKLRAARVIRLRSAKAILPRTYIPRPRMQASSGRLTQRCACAPIFVPTRNAPAASPSLIYPYVPAWELMPTAPAPAIVSTTHAWRVRTCFSYDVCNASKRLGRGMVCHSGSGDGGGWIATALAVVAAAEWSWCWWWRLWW